MQQRNCIHFVGIGGIGMSAIAEILLTQGVCVSGSDLKESDNTLRLRKKGARIFIGHHMDNLHEGVDKIVVSTAVNANNPELVAAREKGIPVVHRAEMLGLIMQGKKAIAIAGTHGKTTTTSMVSLIFEKAGLDPTMLIGGVLPQVGSNAKLGNSDYLIAEADESDGSFLHLNPRYVIVTNVEADHLDYYKGLDEIKDHFTRFLNKVPQDGFIVLCADDPILREISENLTAKVWTYGISADADFVAEEIQFNQSFTDYKIKFEGKDLGMVKLNVPGKHNVLNSLAAAAMSNLLGVEFRSIVDAFLDFRGANRRFQVIGTADGVTVVDDYAHHPTEIKATLAAARQVKGQRVIAIFQPHRYSRTAFFMQQFGEAFEQADIVILTGVYSAGEAPIDGVSSEKLCELVRKNNPDKDVIFIEDKEQIADKVLKIIQAGDVLITLGAGDIWKTAYQVARYLNKEDS